MRPPRVSVILPTYNRVGLLPEAINSVLAQRFPDFELIVVDDGSTDGTDDFLARISDPRLHVVRRPHAGLCAALNAGLAVSQGVYVARNDSDDVWLPDLLGVLVESMDAHPEAGLVYAQCEGMRADGSPSGAIRGFPLRWADDALASLLYTDYTATVTTLFRASCLQRVGRWDASVELAEDWDMAVRIAMHFPILYVDRVLGRYREHGGNCTRLDAPNFETRLAARARVLDKLFAAPDLPPRAATMRSIAYRNLHVGDAVQRLTRHEFRQAGAALRRAFVTGGNPVTTLARIVWYVTVWFGISQVPWAARLVARVARWHRGAPEHAYRGVTS